MDQYFSRPLRLITLIICAVLAVAFASNVYADGEAGLVIQDGATVTTYCIAFSGDGITGDQLLKAAGQMFDAYGGGSGLAVCSIGSQGCSDASSFSSCFCQCQGSACTYWAFFTLGYGKKWVYSSLAFNLLKAKDGDVHGWKWGQGQPNNAPVPQDVTFEQICGHPPQGGVAQPTAAPTPTIQPTLAATLAAPATAVAPNSPAVTVATSETPTISNSTASLTPLVTITGSPTAQISSTAKGTPTVVADAAKSDSSSRGPLVAFGIVAGLMVVAIVAAAVWRTKRG